jgi:hypothetical protein
MKFNLMPASAVEKFKFNEQVIRETAAQVIKDFTSFGMQVSFPADLHFAYDDLFAQLKPIIGDLLQANPEKLAALLYHIDIDEKKTNRPGILNMSYHEWLTGLILEREFIKVLTRHYFRIKTSGE